MSDDYSFREFQENQQRTLDQAVQAFQAYLEALQASRPLKGGMHWKKIKGRQYLYQYRDRYGHGRSLGPRSPATEQLFREFGRQRQDMAARLGRRRQQLAEVARFCRAALIHRVPDPVVRVLRRLEQEDLLGAPLMVIGTQALHAFEFAAGVFIEAPKTSPFWSGAGHRLTLLAAAEIPSERLLGLLSRVDRSFRARPGDDLAAANKHGFLVRCLRPPAARSPQKMLIKDAMGVAVPAESGDLASLVNSPRFSQVVIGRRGDPVTMVVPDPRALALHHLWLSQQEDREPSQKIRDRCQAAALAELILRYLPQYHFFSAELRRFPAEVARNLEKVAEEFALTAELNVEY
jgi:hypothetical protein